MKNLIFITVVMIFFGCLTQKKSIDGQKLNDILPKQHGILFYYGDNGKIIDSDTNAFWAYELLTVEDGYKYFAYYKNQYTSKKWEKQPRETLIEEIQKNYFKFTQKSYNNSTISYREIIDSINNVYFYKEFDENNKLMSEGKTKNKFILQNVDTLFVYYENGQKKSEEYFQNGEMLSNKNWNEDGSEYISDILNPYEFVPEYPGGEVVLQQDIANKIKYPSEAINKGITGTVYVGFVIMEDGNIDGVKVLRSVDKLLDNEAIRVVKNLKKWESGKINGKNIRSGYVIPINFQLN